MKLRPGITVLINHVPHLVQRVNDCCAVVVPLAKKIRSYVPQTGKDAGKVIRFSESRDPFRISANSEVEIVR